MNNTRSIFYFDHTKIKFCAEKKQKKFAISSSQRKIILFGSDRKKAEPGNFISGSSYNVFFIVIKILKVIFEPVRSWYGDGEKFNSDWTYTKSYGGPHHLKFLIPTACVLKIQKY